MSTKRKIKRRRSLSGTNIHRSSKAARKNSLTYKLQRLRFPRRTFLKGVGILGLVSIPFAIKYDWEKNRSCLTWKPGKETWKPTVYAPSEDMEPIDKAIWLVNENICSYSIDDLLHMNLQPDQVYWMLSHQLRVKPITEGDVKFYLYVLDKVQMPYTNQKKLSFPLILQGHECQFIDTLLRCGRSKHVIECKEDSMLNVLKDGGTRKFAVPGGVSCLRDLLKKEIRFSSEHLAFGNSFDPSWIISAFVGTNPKPEDWSQYGDNTGILKHATYGFERISKGGEFRCDYFACGGTHFQDALSRLFWYYGQCTKGCEGEDKKLFLSLQGRIQELIKVSDSKNEPLEYSYHPLNKYYMKWFCEDSSKQFFKKIYSSIERLGHTLELRLDPQGYYHDNSDLNELEPVADALAEAIVEWYTPDFEPHRKLLDSWVLEDRSSSYLDQLKYLSKRDKQELRKHSRQMERYTAIEDSESKYSRLFMGSLCHAAKGLMLWKEYKEQQAGTVKRGVCSITAEKLIEGERLFD